MSDQKDSPEYSIPGGPVDGFAHITTAQVMKDISSCASVKVTATGGIRLHLGDLNMQLPVDTWRPIVAALNAAIAQVDGAPVDIPDNLDALMTAIEDAEVMDGAV